MEPVTMAALIGGGASLLGGLMGRESSRSSANRNVDLQREFAQHGIRWRVEDAKQAGIHPLYALGASTHSFSPISVSDPLGPAIASAGQDLSRAFEATRTGQERNVLDTLKAQESIAIRQLDRERIHDDREERRLQSQLANDAVQRMYWLSQMRRNEQQRGPGMPEAVAGGVSGPREGSIKYKPAEITSRAPGEPFRTAGTAPFFTRTEVAPGVFFDVPNPEVMQDPGELAMSAVTAMAYPHKWWHEFKNRPRQFRQVKPSDAGPWYYDTWKGGYDRYGVNRRGR